MPTRWLQISVHATPDAFDAIANFLVERGSPGVALRKQEVRGYFGEPFDLAAIRRDLQQFLSAIQRFYPKAVSPRLDWRIIRDEDWNKRWRKFIKPQKVGKKFWVTPPWIPVPRLRGRFVITIEPGMAFGTGSHATTRGCLEFIERVARRLKAKPWTALDVGTGSGILSIALAQLGAARVWAVDNDPVALQVAQENLQINGAAKNVRLSGDDLGKIRGSFPLVVANLTAETIVELTAALTKKVGTKGYLVLSGILNGRAQKVIDAMTAAGFALLERKRERQWTSLLLRRK